VRARAARPALRAPPTAVLHACARSVLGAAIEQQQGAVFPLAEHNAFLRDTTPSLG